ncbi:MAG TPA: zf-HC2 domain-containing protein [Thermoanaerobaculia bacterium]|nr:zf-HC2 domain-containing protein [Thermoanaerobaculia bacterium]
MNHPDIEELQIADRYLKGKLPPEEAVRFEEHYLHCQECLDRLKLAESMERGFHRGGLGRGASPGARRGRSSGSTRTGGSTRRRGPGAE